MATPTKQRKVIVTCAVTGPSMNSAGVAIREVARRFLRRTLILSRFRKADEGEGEGYHDYDEC